MDNPQATPAAGSEYGSDIDLQVTAAVSDYGSDLALEDFDADTILADVLDSINHSKPTGKDSILPSLEFEEGELEDEEHVEDGLVQVHRLAGLRVAKEYDVHHTGSQMDAQRSPSRRHEALEIEYDARSRRAWSVPLEQPRPLTQDMSRPSSENHLDQKVRPNSTQQELSSLIHADDRSPLDRFRTKPQKPLSVTDLISPAWCELQYLYTLTKFGRKPRTAAMKIGSRIHQRLEDEVHTTVPVQVESKEDRFALRIWNSISGLRCLRDTGLTRELEVWGIIEGQVVNGVIDELSHQCPDPEFEERVEKERAERDGGIIPLTADQTGIIEDFAGSSGERNGISLPGRIIKDEQVYIADVKTRSSNSLPAGASLRPTWMQLMLYRKLLESLSLNTVDAETIFARYSLRPLESFTDSFFQQIGQLGPLDEVEVYPNLMSLWSLLVTEMQNALPATSISPVLRAEFRYAKTGDVIGSELITYDANRIEQYTGDEMKWWKGAREAKGVEIEEAFKCRICEFAEGCSWRKTKVEDATEKSRLRRQGAGKSAV